MAKSQGFKQALLRISTTFRSKSSQCMGIGGICQDWKDKMSIQVRNLTDHPGITCKRQGSAASEFRVPSVFPLPAFQRYSPFPGNRPDGVETSPG